MADDVAKRRFRVTMTNAMVEGMEKLIEEGIYKDRKTVFEGAIDHLFRYHGMKSSSEKVKPDADASSEQ